MTFDLPEYFQAGNTLKGARMTLASTNYGHDKTFGLLNLIVVIIALIFTSPLSAQNEFWVGLEPSVVIEPDYENDEIDLGLLQLTVRGNLSGNMDWRLLILNNFHIGGESGINDVGVEMAAPVYLRQEENNTGWYFAPVLSLVNNLRLNQLKMTTALEVGNSIAISEKLGLNVGMQLGVTRFPGGDWRNHFGIKVQIGRWLHLS